MTGLMYNKPEDHVAYLKECLEQIQNEGNESITWKKFIRIKSPLPPIPSQGSTPRSQTPRNGELFSMISYLGFERFLYIDNIIMSSYLLKLILILHSCNTCCDQTKHKRGIEI